MLKMGALTNELMPFSSLLASSAQGLSYESNAGIDRRKNQSWRGPLDTCVYLRHVRLAWCGSSFQRHQYGRHV